MSGQRARLRAAGHVVKLDASLRAADRDHSTSDGHAAGGQRMSCQNKWRVFLVQIPKLRAPRSPLAARCLPVSSQAKAWIGPDSAADSEPCVWPCQSQRLIEPSIAAEANCSPSARAAKALTRAGMGRPVVQFTSFAQLPNVQHVAGGEDEAAPFRLRGRRCARHGLHLLRQGVHPLVEIV